ncbi:hypothetical protein C8R43DRAFT_1127363 [Mycena crocata]|nr:hypothetical protein C8R43DRAFT_1127363 [Mycena crocata]
MDNYNWESVLNLDDCWSPTPVWELPTPPHSQANSPPTHSPEDKSSLVSVSTTFFPAFQHRCHPPDLILLSDDAVHFYVHSDLLLGLSDNSFNGMLPIITPVDGNEPPILAISEPSPVLNIILHAIYDMTCAQYSPPFETLVNAVDSMPIYGISPKAIIRPSTPLFMLLLFQAPLFPLESYALAAHHDILDLAVPISSHMLAFPLSSLSDQIVERIGASYLKRQASPSIHLALKRVLLLPPHPHAPTADCDFSSQKVVSRAWALASAYLAWDVRPDLSTATLESALRPLAAHISCGLCKQALNNRVHDVIVQWTVVKRTI